MKLTWKSFCFSFFLLALAVIFGWSKWKVNGRMDMILISRENHVIAVRGINISKRQVGVETGNVVTWAELNSQSSHCRAAPAPAYSANKPSLASLALSHQSVHARPPTYPYYGLPLPTSACHFTPTVSLTRTSNPHGRLEHAGGELVGRPNLQYG